MNPNQFMELLKNLQKIMKCPSCGAIYKIEEIQFLGQVDGIFLLQMSCTKCHLLSWMNFMINKDRGKNKYSFSELKSLNDDMAIKESISPDEILDFHGFLESFDGNFKKEITKGTIL